MNKTIFNKWREKNSEKLNKLFEMVNEELISNNKSSISNTSDDSTTSSNLSDWQNSIIPKNSTVSTNLSE